MNYQQKSRLWKEPMFEVIIDFYEPADYTDIRMRCQGSYYPYKIMGTPQGKIISMGGIVLREINLRPLMELRKCYDIDRMIVEEITLLDLWN